MSGIQDVYAIDQNMAVLVDWIGVNAVIHLQHDCFAIKSSRIKAVGARDEGGDDDGSGEISSRRKSDYI